MGWSKNVVEVFGEFRGNVILCGVGGADEAVKPTSVWSVEAQLQNGPQCPIVLVPQRVEYFAAVGPLAAQCECLIGGWPHSVRRVPCTA